MSQITPPRAPEVPQATPVAAAPVGGRFPSATAAADTIAATSAPNPALRLDPELGLVVLEFRNLRGEEAATIPTSRELEAYRRAARTGAPPPAS
jgi:hypothetical protein